MTFRILIILLSTYYVSAQQQDLIGAAATANNDFSFKLLQQLSQGKSDNVFYSPFSINTALAMTYLGARGNTAQEMDRALGFNRINAVGGNNAVHIAYQQLLQRYNNPNQNFTLSAANKMYPANNFEVLPQFKSNMRQFYNAEPESLDYANQAPQAASTINNWVSQQTNGKIKDLFSPDSFNSMTRLVLVSAIYFKGTWKTKFDEAKTKKADFFVSQNQKVQVDMMEQTSEFKFLQSTQDRLKMIELPYSGGELSMFIILPDEINGVSRVVNLLDAQKFNQLRSGLSSQTVHVKLPKFKLETKYSLVDTLKQMGINDLFDARSGGLSAVAPTFEPPIAVSSVLHNAMVETDEHGTVAAAASGVIGTPLTAMMPNRFAFEVDRPFVAIIARQLRRVDRAHILFLGVVRQPGRPDSDFLFGNGGRPNGQENGGRPNGQESGGRPNGQGNGGRPNIQGNTGTAQPGFNQRQTTRRRNQQGNRPVEFDSDSFEPQDGTNGGGFPGPRDQRPAFTCEFFRQRPGRRPAMRNPPQNSVVINRISDFAGGLGFEARCNPKNPNNPRNPNNPGRFF